MKQQIKTLTSLAEFNQLEEAWNSLLTSSSLPFHTFGWYQSLFEIYPHSREGMIVFVLEQNDDVTAIMPCRKDRKTLALFSDTIGIQADIITKDRQAAACLMKHVLKFAREENICARFDGVGTNSYLYQSFTAHSLNGNNPLLDEPQTKQLQLDLEPFKSLATDSADIEFQVFEGREISRNLLLEIEQFHNRIKQKSNHHFQTEEFIPFLNLLRYQNPVGITIHTLRNNNRDLISIDLGFRRGRNYYSSVYLRDPKSSANTERHHLELQISYLKRKGVRSILTQKTNQLLLTTKAKQPIETHRCVAYSPTKKHQYQFQLKRQKQDSSEQLHHFLTLFKIRTRLFGDVAQKRADQSRIVVQGFFKESSSRIKERRSSST